jgi:hypothetical protein
MPYIFYTKEIKNMDYIEHGENCKKVKHVGEGFLHSPKYDDLYFVDGCAYCGRCHIAIYICPKCGSKLPF